MKKALCIAAAVWMLLLVCGGCGEKEQEEMETKTITTISFENGAADADVWILPKTEKNLKTTVWGTATIADVKKGESKKAPLCKAGDDGLYLLRMIDHEGFYYSANGLMLKDGWTIRIKEAETNVFVAEVTDETGAPDKTYDVFSARL